MMVLLIHDDDPDVASSERLYRLQSAETRAPTTSTSGLADSPRSASEFENAADLGRHCEEMSSISFVL
jgi:hypothetical protein